MTPKVPENIYAETVKYLDQGKIVGWFQGQMEYGQRALGSRSILADPRRSEMKRLINQAVKFRESFRPFAPAILEETLDEWFDYNNSLTSPYMEKVVKVKQSRAAEIPSVVHWDGSCRLQTVKKDMTPEFHALITEWNKETGVPILLNTSFNINNEPIVESPIDAIKTFFSSGLDILVIGSFLISKT